MITAVFERIESRGVHSENPVANGAAYPGKVETLIVGLLPEMCESIANGLIGH